MKISQKSEKGFTLIELLIVIVIIGVLATFLMANFVGVRQRARDAQRKSDLRQIQSALELYRSDNGIYALTMADCDVSLSSGETVYIQKIPCDPLSTTNDRIPYTYEANESGSTYSLKACLENDSDSQKDSVNTCSTGYSFTLQNP